MEIWKIAFAVAGIGGVAAFVFWSLYKQWLSLPIFPMMTKDQSFRLFKIFLFLTFILAIFGIAAYAYVTTRSTNPTKAVRVFLKFRGEPLLSGFQLAARGATFEDVEKSGERGSTTLILPSAVEEIEMKVTCPGYRTKDPSPYKIVGDTIDLAMVRLEDVPLHLETLPNPLLVPGPTSSELMQEPLFDPKDVIFFAKNDTDVDLRLLVYNCSHDRKKGILDGTGFFDRKFPCQSDYQKLSGFEDISGWFKFWVIEGKSIHYVGYRNLRLHEKTTLTVKHTLDPAQPFAGTFSP